MDLGLVAAVMSVARRSDDRRYADCSMFSALPGAPVQEERRQPWLGRAVRPRKPKERALREEVEAHRARGQASDACHPGMLLG